MDTNVLLDTPIFSSAAADVKPASLCGRFGCLSLRTQGIMLLSLGAILVVAYGLFLIAQKDKLRDTFATLNSKQQLEGRFYRLSADMGRIDRDFDNSIALPNPRAKLPFVEGRLKAVFNEVQDLLPNYPELKSRSDKLSEYFVNLHHDASIERLHEAGIQIHYTADEVDRVIEQISSDRRLLSDDWYRANMGVAASSAVASLVALLGFGSFSIFFFTRLTSDVRKLSASAREIALGRPFQPIAVTRHDEVGDLMEAMNWMATQLAEREMQLVIARQQYFHAEKMVAISSLAAGVAHEIGNPLETISAVAQAISEAKNQACKSRGLHCHPDLILEQIGRVANITRELSNFSGPSQPELKLLGLNELIRDTCRFMRYDRRYRHIELVANLDPQIPALRIVGDQFVQVFMNLLINAADAFDPTPKSAPQVSITTRLVESSILVQLDDNGSGMEEVTLNQAFDPFFTTKSVGEGSGLGLAVCKSIIEAYGGTLTLESKLGIGTSVKMLLPLGWHGKVSLGGSHEGGDGSIEKTSLAAIGERP